MVKEITKFPDDKSTDLCFFVHVHLWIPWFKGSFLRLFSNSSTPFPLRIRGQFTTPDLHHNLSMYCTRKVVGSSANFYVFMGWRRGSVVRTSVCGWQTFPDLRLIHGWHVTTLWVKCPLWVNQPGQLSLPSLRGRQTSSDPWITWITRVATIKRQTRAGHGC